MSDPQPLVVHTKPVYLSLSTKSCIDEVILDKAYDGKYSSKETQRTVEYITDRVLRIIEDDPDNKTKLAGLALLIRMTGAIRNGDSRNPFIGHPGLKPMRTVYARVKDAVEQDMGLPKPP